MTSESALPTGKEKDVFVREMFDRISHRYDLVNRIMTFGLDMKWRRIAVAELGLPRPCVVLDVASGTGDFCRELAAAGLRPVGLDFSMGMLENATGVDRAVQSDASNMPIRSGSVEGITCGFALRNFSDLRSVLLEFGRVCKPGARIALLEVSTPANPILAFGHRLHFQKLVPLIGSLLSDAPAYQYLPRSFEYLPGPDVLADWICDAGFVNIRRRQLSGGATQLISATRDTGGGKC